MLKKKTFSADTTLADARRKTFARRAPNHFWGLVFSVVVLAACLAVFAFRLATRSAFDREGEQEVQGVSDAVGLHRNEYGIVHITAKSDNDAYFGIGYAHAQDRLWQMDFLRRVGRGRLSEIFGRRTLEQDIFLRAMRFDSIANALTRQISPESRSALQAYANGVNAYLTTHEGKIAAEFDALEYQPEPWRVEDCLLVMRLWAWELNSTFTADLVLTAIADSLGRERALQLLPPPDADPYFAPSVLDSLLPKRPTANALQSAPILDSLNTDSVRQQTTTATLSSHRRSTPPSSSERRGTKERLAHLAESARNAANIRGSSLGSNAWAVRSSVFFHPEQDSIKNFPSKYRHGAILAADAHLALTLPARWYEAHLSSPTLNVLGHTLPGLPFVIVGRNDRIGWSLVSAMVDDTDFFAERLDSTDLRRYWALDSAGNRVSEPFRLVADTIKVKDSS
ncbi:MAG: penicillin acylase family protein, partial [Candidatus Kapaibacteriota bacterium]